MGTGIYLVGSDKKLIEMTEQPYAKEDLLQELLADHPNLLAGGQIDSASPRRWLLISREAGIPDANEAADRWAVDHVFLDQDAVPTLVEVKRSSDTRIRREVVGQMLDYAANAVMYWPAENLRSQFEEACNAPGRDPNVVLRDTLGVVDAEAFWQTAKTNLKAGKLRLVFVADVIPRELQRIVEFLNEQMDPTEVLAVEIKQFVGGAQTTLVPRVIGQTAEAQRTKATTARPGRDWNEASFMEDLLQRRGPREVEAARELLAWAKRRATQVWWGRGAVSGSFVAVLNHKGLDHQLFAAYTSGGVEIYFQWLKGRQAFAADEKRLELLSRLNAATKLGLGVEVIARRPSVPLELLAASGTMGGFLAMYDWVVDEIVRT